LVELILDRIGDQRHQSQSRFEGDLRLRRENKIWTNSDFGDFDAVVDRGTDMKVKIS
jgi:hypothetical protein